MPPGAVVPLRGRIVQFSEGFIADAARVLPELVSCAGVLELSRRGALFSPATAKLVETLLKHQGAWDRLLAPYLVPA